MEHGPRDTRAAGIVSAVVDTMRKRNQKRKMQSTRVDVPQSRTVATAQPDAPLRCQSCGARIHPHTGRCPWLCGDGKVHVITLS